MEVHVVMVILVLGAGLWDVETDAVTLTQEEGRDIEIKCSHFYAATNDKYLCKGACTNEDVLIHTGQELPNGKYSIRDEGNTFYVTISDLTIDDAGVYWCGIDRVGVDTFNRVDLTVTEQHSPKNLSLHTTEEPAHHNIIVDKHNLPLFLTAVMCFTLLFVFLFILCLLAVKKQRPSREMSTDHVTVMAGVRPEPEHRCRCSSPDWSDVSGFPPPPPDLCFHFTSTQRESTVTLGGGDYVDVDVSERICQYQGLDLSRLEEHVYHSLHGNSGPKDRTRVKE